MSFLDDLLTDLKGQSLDKSRADKQKYRLAVVGLAALAAVGLWFVYPPAMIAPAALAAWKLKIILTDR
jgi:hypothetical protein